MTRLFNDPASFTQQTISGFVAAHPRWVRSVPGGVARSTHTPSGQVAVTSVAAPATTRRLPDWSDRVWPPRR